MKTPQKNISINEDELQTMFVRRQHGRLIADEAQRLEQWRAASPEHEREWLRLVALWQAAAAHHVPEGSSREAQWVKLSARLEEADGIPLADSWAARVRRWFAHVLPQPRRAYAALAVVLLFIALRFVDFNAPSELQNARASFGERAQLILPDGSRVELNAGSALRYPQKFSQQTRRVELQGEAFFEVRRGEIPFEVITPHTRVRVLGTSFNVRTWDHATTVFVQSGKVALRSPHSNTNAEVIVASGQAARCADSLRILTEANAAAEMLAWRAGKLVFHRRPLTEVLEELQRHFNVRIQAEEKLLAHTVTASFANEPLTVVLDAIAAALEARYESNTEGYWLRVNARGREDEKR